MTEQIKLGAPKSLRELRCWHWRTAKFHRGRAEHLRRYGADDIVIKEQEELADLHFYAVEILDGSLPGTTAEQDCAV